MDVVCGKHGKPVILKTKTEGKPSAVNADSRRREKSQWGNVP
jgi:hypothetical protein